MKVIPKQTEYYVIHLDYSEEMYINLGKHLTKDVDFKLTKGAKTYYNELIILMKNNEIKAKYDDYLLVGINDNKNLLYVEKDKFKENYIEVKEEN